MRRGNEPFMLTSEDDTFLGVNLSVDFTAEHEWGIDDLKRLFGMSAERSYKPFGMKRHRIKECNTDCVLFREEGKFAILIVDSPMRYTTESIDKVSSLKAWLNKANWDGLHMDEQELVAAWSGRDLGIAVQGKENVLKLKQLYEAMQKKDAVIFLGGRSGPIGNAGLNLCILSAIPQEYLDSMKNGDIDLYKMVKAAEKTGIKKKIDEYNSKSDDNYKMLVSCWKPHGYMALSPRWANEDEKERTKYDVVFWLNPYNQDIHNFGWFTVEELEQWLEDEGPILKSLVTK